MAGIAVQGPVVYLCNRKCPENIWGVLGGKGSTRGKGVQGVKLGPVAQGKRDQRPRETTKPMKRYDMRTNRSFTMHYSSKNKTRTLELLSAFSVWLLFKTIFKLTNKIGSSTSGNGRDVVTIVIIQKPRCRLFQRAFWRRANWSHCFFYLGLLTSSGLYRQNFYGEKCGVNVTSRNTVKIMLIIWQMLEV